MRCQCRELERKPATRSHPPILRRKKKVQTPAMWNVKVDVEVSPQRRTGNRLEPESGVILVPADIPARLNRVPAIEFKAARSWIGGGEGRGGRRKKREREEFEIYKWSCNWIRVCRGGISVTGRVWAAWKIDESWVKSAVRVAGLTPGAAAPAPGGSAGSGGGRGGGRGSGSPGTVGGGRGGGRGRGSPGTGGGGSGGGGCGASGGCWSSRGVITAGNDEVARRIPLAVADRFQCNDTPDWIDGHLFQWLPRTPALNEIRFIGCQDSEWSLRSNSWNVWAGSSGGRFLAG